MGAYGRFDLVYERTDRNGTKYYLDYNCPRCFGEGGSEAWKYTEYTCWKCGGSGKRVLPRTVKVYTPEYEAKLAARRAAKMPKVDEEEQRRLEEQRKAEQERLIAEQKAEEERRRGNFIGEAGQKIEVKVVYDYHVNFETMYGISTVYNFKDADNNTLVWVTGSCLQDKAGNAIGEGETITIKGTIKEHKEYRGINQTVLTRVKVI